ncbi:elongation factor P [candidate division WOR-3 bacterium]|nr:elongation factor P [candidate division WOR-3 bacterium]
MATTQDLRKGLTIKLEGELFTVIDFAHIKIGRGGAFVRIKIKNLHTGAVLERTLSAGENIETVKMREKEMQYIYQDGNLYYFMDQETYEQIPLSSELLGDVLKYLKENGVVNVLLADDKTVGVKMPNFCELKVVTTEPPLKGARASGGLKPATLETGAQVRVPLFINSGDVIKIDTRTNEYIERAK